MSKCVQAVLKEKQSKYYDPKDWKIIPISWLVLFVLFSVDASFDAIHRLLLSIEIYVIVYSRENIFVLFYFRDIPTSIRVKWWKKFCSILMKF